MHIYALVLGVLIAEASAGIFSKSVKTEKVYDDRFEDCGPSTNAPFSFVDLEFPIPFRMDGTVNNITGKFRLGEDMSPDDLFELKVEKKMGFWFTLPCIVFGLKGPKCIGPISHWHRIGKSVLCPMLKSFGKEIITKEDGEVDCEPGIAAGNYPVQDMPLDIPSKLIHPIIVKIAIAVSIRYALA